MIGDSYTLNGFASGSGRDKLHGLAGNDTLRGDDYAAWSQGVAEGGAKDTLNGADGNDNLDGGPAHDICAGGGGSDSASRCEFRLQIP